MKGKEPIIALGSRPGRQIVAQKCFQCFQKEEEWKARRTRALTLLPLFYHRLPNRAPPQQQRIHNSVIHAAFSGPATTISQDESSQRWRAQARAGSLPTASDVTWCTCLVYLDALCAPPPTATPIYTASTLSKWCQNHVTLPILGALSRKQIIFKTKNRN